MMKFALVALCAGLAGSAITLTNTTIYSSPLQAAYPIGSAIKTVTEAANIWSATITPVWNQQTESVLVDIDGDQQMDTVHPGIRVLITDILNTGNFCDIVDSSGVRWSLNQNAGASPSGNEVHLQTPIVLPINSDLRVVWPNGATGGRVQLIGRVINL